MKNFAFVAQARGIAGQLAEVGKKISKKNADRLRKAMQEIQDLLAQVDTAESLSEAERSQRERMSLLSKAVRAKFATSESLYVYLSDVFDTTLVYSDYDTYWQCSYSIADDGTVTLGDPVEVIPHMTYDPAPAGAIERFTGTGNAVPLFEEGCNAGTLILTEAQLSEATAQIKLIDPGWGSSGYYSAEMLKRDGPAAFPKGTHMYLDHMSEREKQDHPENSVKRLAAVLEADAQWQDNGPRGPALYAPARIGTSHEALIKDFKSDIGVSISAGGVRVAGEAEGRKGYIITKLDPRSENPFNSVDFVTLPGRGGEIVSLFEAAGQGPVANSRKEPSEMTKEEIQALISESNKPLVDRVTAVEAENTTLKTTNARLTETIALQSARGFVEARLKPINLPAATKQRLAESLPVRATLKDGKLDEAAFGAIVDQAAKDEAEYLKSVGIGGGVVGMGASVAEATEPKAEDIEKQLVESLASLGGLEEKAAQKAAAGRFAA